MSSQPTQRSQCALLKQLFSWNLSTGGASCCRNCLASHYLLILSCQNIPSRQTFVDFFLKDSKTPWEFKLYSIRFLKVNYAYGFEWFLKMVNKYMWNQDGCDVERNDTDILTFSFELFFFNICVPFSEAEKLLLEKQDHK